MGLKNIITEELLFNREIHWLFDFTQNFEERTKWDKQTKEIGYLDDYNKLKKGAKVYTESLEGIRMDTEYLTFQKPNEISIKMLNKSNIFKKFKGTWNYIEVDNNQTILKITYKFNLRFPYRIIKNIVLKKIKSNVIKKLNYLDNYLKENTVLTK